MCACGGSAIGLERGSPRGVDLRYGRPRLARNP